MSNPADRDLLFGVLCVQNGFVRRPALIEAMNDWALAQDRPLGDILKERGDLSPAHHDLVAALLAAQLERHQGDAAASLAALESAAETKESLRALADAKGQASLGATVDEQSAAQAPAAVDRSASRFQVIQPHARGGLGEVFLAQDSEVPRQVALKEIRGDREADENSVGRFVKEAEITGQLEHPGVVPIYGAGRYSDGRPYYAMRFIHGKELKAAIAEFHAMPEAPAMAPSERPSLARQASQAKFNAREFRDLLGRFVDLCQAVAYAHSRGVLHRDLKPGNVMLGKYGETLVVDWGLAKVIGREDPASGEQTVQPSSGDSGATLPGNVLGTPAYMSPEQAAGKVDQLGPATDIYALGAILHAILTGEPPVGGRTIQETLDRVARGDLWPTAGPKPLAAVARKAMALRPADRHSAALDLAADVERFLADEPVSAYRDPPLAKAARWTRKRPGTTAGAAAAALMMLAGLAIGLAVVGGYNQRLAAARDEIAEERNKLATSLAEEERQRALALSNEALATRRAGQLEKSIEALAGVFQNLNPDSEEKEGLPLRAILGRNLDSVTTLLAKEGAGDALATARLLEWLGRAQLSLGQPSKARELFAETHKVLKGRLGPDHPDTLTCANNLASAYAAMGQADKALELHAETHKLMKAKLGPDHPDTLTAMQYLAESLRRSGQSGKALELQSEALKLRQATLGTDHPETLYSMNKLAEAFRAAGQPGKALELHAETLKLMKAKLGPDHPETLTTMNNLAEACRAAGQLSKALDLHAETLKLRQARLGPDHPRTLVSMSNLAVAYWSAKRHGDAVELFGRLLKLCQAKHGPNHPETLKALGNLGVNYRDAGRHGEAVATLEDAIARVAKLPPADRDALSGWIRPNLTSAYENAGRHDKAEPARRQAVAAAAKLRGPDHPAAVAAEVMLANNLLKQSKNDEAESLLRHALAVREREAPDAWTTCGTRSMLGEALLRQKRLAEAEPLVLSGYEGIAKQRDKVPADVQGLRLREAAGLVASLFDAKGDKAKAAEWRAKHPPATKKADKEKP